MEERSHLSSLKFLNYIVNSVNYKANENLTQKDSWNLVFNIHNTTSVTNEKDKMKIQLGVDVFKGVEDAPFYIDAEITGFFEIEGEEDISIYEANAIAIMYPYLRAIISNYTASANVFPVILPAINVNAMLKKQEGKRTSSPRGEM